MLRLNQTIWHLRFAFMFTYSCIQAWNILLVQEICFLLDSLHDIRAGKREEERKERGETRADDASGPGGDTGMKAINKKERERQKGRQRNIL